MNRALKKNPDIIKNSGKNLSGFNGFDLAMGIVDGFRGMLTASPEEHKRKYEKRKIGRYEEGGIMVSTVFADDTGYYETAIIDPCYHDELLVVQEYETKEEAAMGRKEWIHALLSDPPLAVKEIQNDEIFLRRPK